VIQLLPIRHRSRTTAPDQIIVSLPMQAPFAARVDELRGDAYALQGKVAQAIEAYRNAQTAKLGPANETFLRQKLDDLGAQD